MTRFQRRMMAIVTYAISEELEARNKGVSISDRYVKIYSDDKSWLMNVKVEQLSWNKISIVDLYSNFKFFSEVISDFLRFKSEDQESVRLELNDLSQSLMQGKDGRGNWFKARVEGYKKIKITDDEFNQDFVYLLEW